MNPDIGKEGKPWQFKPGNPGRPPGTRHKLKEKFVKALCADFEEHGVKAIQDAREADPSSYLRVIASLLPREVEIKRPLEDVDDDELDAAIAHIRRELGESAGSDGAGATAEAGAKPH